MLSNFTVTWGIGCIFRRNSGYSSTFLPYPAELSFHMPPENGNGKKLTPEEFVSASATADLHNHFLRKSAINFTFLLLFFNTHQQTQTPKTFCLCEDRLSDVDRTWEGGKFQQRRFSSEDWITGSGKTGAVLYAGNGPQVGNV